jgi:hypothetical protein
MRYRDLEPGNGELAVNRVKGLAFCNWGRMAAPRGTWQPWFRAMDALVAIRSPVGKKPDPPIDRTWPIEWDGNNGSDAMSASGRAL